MKVSHLLAMVAILGLAGFAMAARGNKAPTTGLHGKVVSVDTTAKTVIVKPKTGDNVTVTTDATTTVTLDGAAAALADLKAGMVVTVTPATGVAAKIIAKTPKK